MRSLSGRPWLRNLWSAQVISTTGTQVTALAVPTIAIFLFHANPFELAMLVALQFLPTAVLGVGIGQVVDRRSSRTLMILADVGRAIAIASIPAAAAIGVLSLYQLYAVTLVVGTLASLWTLASQSLVPALTTAEELPRTNAALQVGQSGALTWGPGLGGVVVQVVGAVQALVIDVVSYVASIVLVWRLPTTERTASPVHTGYGQGMVEGLRIFRASPMLLRIGLAAATLNLGGSIEGGLYVYFYYRIIGLPPVALGVTNALNFAGTLIGAVAGPMLLSRFGIKNVLTWCGAAAGLVFFLIPLSARTGLPTLVVYNLGFGIASGVWQLSLVTFIQTSVARETLGTVNGTMRSLLVSTLPLGSLAGGLLALQVGVVTTLVLGACIGALTPLWLLWRAGSTRVPEPASQSAAGER